MKSDQPLRVWSRNSIPTGTRIANPILVTMIERLALIGAGLLLVGCSHTLKPIATGSHSQLEENPSSRRAVVWSNNAGVSSAVVEWL